jgi:hypothetical protein
MAFGLKSVGLALLAILMIVSARPARAAAEYQGIYLIIDPYNVGNLRALQSAASVPCTPAQQTITTPFCGAVNGVLLRTAWCSFQLYHVNNPQGKPYSSCHYIVGYANGGTSTTQHIAATDTISPCTTTYDTCSGSTTSVLSASIAAIVQINASRAAAGLDPLRLSLGLYAGYGTPQTVLDSGGYVDVGHNSAVGNRTSTNQCVRLPLPWPAAFTTAYDTAVGQFVTYIETQMPQGANIAILKAAGNTANDIEISMPGRPNAIVTPTDSGPAGPGAALNCSSTITSAQVWLSAYTASPAPGLNFSQAIETAFGTVIGYDAGLLANAGVPNALISIPTTNSTVYAMVDCGVSGSSTCAESNSTGNWSVYYFEHYVIDMFTGGLAHTAAATAYQAIRSDTFSMPAAQLSVNWTGLSPTAVDTQVQIACALNNTLAAYAPSTKLVGQQVQILGVGTTVGWQTNTNEGSECQAGTYGTTLTNGTENGGLFLEVELDAAYTDISACSPYLTNALAQVTAAAQGAPCTY